MTYSQRLTDAANSSDIIYLEYQIGVTEEELKKANEQRKKYESELQQWRTSRADRAMTGESEEIKLIEQLDQVHTLIETIRTRLINLQEELGKLGD